MKSHLLELLESSSFPGVPIVIKSKQSIVKLIWLVFILLLLAASIYFVTDSILTFFKYEKITNIDVFSEQTSPFPAISFCMFFKYSNQSNISNSENFIFENSFFESTILNATDFEVVHFPIRINSELSSDFTCFRFNSGKNALNQSTALRNATKNEVWTGLHVYFNTSNMIYLDQSKSKIASFVNNASEIFRPIRFHLQDNTNLLVNGINSIKIEREFVQKLPEPHNHCLKQETPYHASKFYDYFNHIEKNYRQKDCLDLCILEIMKPKCNCKQTFGEYSECGNESLSCIFKESYFDINSNKKIIPYDCYAKCPKECDHINYKTYRSNMGPASKYSLSTISEEDLTYVNVFYAKLEYTLIDQIAKMNLFDLFSSVGGIFGLFIGLSFFTFVETIQIVFEFIGNNLTDRFCKKTYAVSIENRLAIEKMRKNLLKRRMTN